MKRKVIVLFSGGLDSILAYKIVEKWGFFPLAVNFITPFLKRLDRDYFWEKYNILFREIDFTTKQFEVIKHPVYGYGKAINPCIDCHAGMIRIALEIMKKQKALFVVTGEVVGQRPMSQRKDAMNSVEKLSGGRGYVVRPLSGRLLPPTIPEQNGDIRREWLYNFSGRGRKQQYALCKKFGIDDIPSSGGGCLLTERSFVERVKIAIKYDNVDMLMFLNKGRVFDLGGAVLIVARDKEESDYIRNNAKRDVIEPKGVIGPSGVLFGSNKSHEACGIIGRYSKTADNYIECTYNNYIIKEKINYEKNGDTVL